MEVCGGLKWTTNSLPFLSLRDGVYFPSPEPGLAWRVALTSSVMKGKRYCASFRPKPSKGRPFLFCALGSQLPCCQEAPGLLNGAREHRQVPGVEIPAPAIPCELENCPAQPTELRYHKFLCFKAIQLWGGLLHSNSH